MAIGIAKIFDIDLMKNFDRPYFSTSIVEFWRRWHISLSTWFRDYVYFPMGGNKHGLYQWCLNVLVVFLISGFWHGAKWTFVIWGSVHGLAMIVSRLAEPVYGKFEKNILEPLRLKMLFNFILTFSFVNLAWVFFRINSLRDLSLMTRLTLQNFGFSLNIADFSQQISTIGMNCLDFSFLLLAILTLIILDFLQGRELMPVPLISPNPLLRRFTYSTLILIILAFGYFGKSTFIYFQF